MRGVSYIKFIGLKGSPLTLVEVFGNKADETSSRSSNRRITP